MKKQDFALFSKELLRLALVFGETMTPVRAELYFETLSDLPAEAVLNAIRRACKTCRYFPRPADLIELSGLQMLSPEMAWEQVLIDQPREKLPENIQRALRSIGAPEAGMLNPDRGFYLGDRQVEAIRREFIRFYSAIPNGDSLQVLDRITTEYRRIGNGD